MKQNFRCVGTFSRNRFPFLYHFINESIAVKIKTLSHQKMPFINPIKEIKARKKNSEYSDFKGI
jgi:hypothetical protein